MSYFVSKIGHLDPRFYSYIYCVNRGSRCRGSRCPTLFPKLDISTPVATVLYTVRYRRSRFRVSRCRGSRCRGSRCRGSRCRGSRCPIPHYDINKYHPWYIIMLFKNLISHFLPFSLKRATSNTRNFYFRT